MALPRRLEALVGGLPRTYWFLWLGLLITRIGNFVVPMLMVYLTQQRGLSLTAAGSIVSCFGAGALIGNLSGGTLADRLGRRPTILLSLLGGAMAMTALGMAQTPLQLSAAAGALGLLGEMYRPAASAVVADVVPDSDRLRAFTLQYWAVNLGFAIAASLGGALAKSHFNWLFIGDAATTIIFAGVVFFHVPETRPARRPEHSEGSALTPFVDPQFAPFLLITGLFCLVIFQHLVAMPADMLAKGMDSADYGLATGLNGVIIVLFQPLIASVGERWPRVRTLVIASLLTGAGFGLMAFARTLPMVMVTVVVWTAGEMLFAPVNSAIVAEAAPPHLRGRYQGAFSLVWAVAFTAAPLLSPWLIARSSYEVLWGACFGVCVLAALGHAVRSVQRVESQTVR